MSKKINLTNLEKRNIVKEDYDNISIEYSKISNIENYVCYLDEFISSLNGTEILDIGCGSGETAKYFTKNKLDVTGLDFSQNLIAIAKKNSSNINFICEDVCQWDSKEKFDGIFSKDMLFHLPDEDLINVLKKVNGLLKTNGIFYVIMDIPKVSGEQILTESLNEKYKIYYNYLMPEKFKNFLLNAGFKINDEIILDEGFEDYIYAKGVMIFKATKN